MAGKFPLYTDADIRGSLVKGLRKHGRDVVRSVEAFPEGTDDDVHFEKAAELRLTHRGSVFLTTLRFVRARRASSVNSALLIAAARSNCL